VDRLLKSKYRIGEQISENPFSVTYRGFFVGTDKPVVVKIYKRGTLNSSIINRMKQKVKALSLMSYYGIAKLIDGDYGWQGFYYVREYIEGESLRELLKREPNIGLDKILTIIEETSRTLEFAHSKGIIHGALKPNNIFIDKQGMVKVADFVVEGEIKEAMPQKALTIMDDGKYLSPEEIAGHPAASLSDLYALGMIFFEAITRQPLLREGGLRGGLQKVKTASVINREALKEYPRYLQDILSKALQTDPLNRFASMADFRESIENRGLLIKNDPAEEYATVFDNTVTRYGEDTPPERPEELEDLGRMKIRWGNEKHRMWLLALILGLAFVSGILYSMILNVMAR
jgi:serine/threonine-protein kinase